MNIKIENVLWQFAKVYRDKFIASHPNHDLNMSMAAVAMFRALEANGDAVEQADPDTRWQCYSEGDAEVSS